MASHAISNQYYDRVIKSTKILLLVIAGAILFALGTTAVQAKFDSLKFKIAEGLSNPPITMAERERQLDCLTKNIYWEAASEPFEGKVAVAQVTMNRVQSGKFADNVCGVVYQKNTFYQKVICQFSWVCESTHMVKPVYAPLYKESQEVAKKVLLENFRLPGLTNAMYYHAAYVSPGWRKERIAQIGQHIFYKE
jgi:spore germination cell wall hydrolase CwlJ-like protein